MMNASFEFHPVGQGLFYTGNIYDEGTPFSFVYDCGGEKRFIGREIESYYRRHGSKELDLIVLSHLHADHINGVKKLLGLTTDPNDSKRTRVVMPYSNKAMNLLYEFEYIIKNGYNKEVSQFYNDPIRTIRSFRDCEIILVTSDIETAVYDAEDDGLDFRPEKELKGVNGTIYKLHEGSGSGDNSKEYSNVYLVEALNGVFSSKCWFYSITQPSFDFSKFELFRQICKMYGISEAIDIFRNKAALSEIRT